MEAVFVVPLLFALLLGITTGGEAYAKKISIVEAVREGARYGATLRLGTGPTAVSDLESSVSDRVVAASAGTLSAGNICVRLLLPGQAVAPGCDPQIADPAGASAQPTVHLVKISASKAAIVQFFFLSTTSTLTGKLAARYERDTG